MRTLLVLMMLLISGAVIAQSNPTAPSEAKGGTQKQDKTAKSAGDSCSDKDCSKLSPSVIVNVSPTQTINPEAANKSSEKNHESPTEWLTALATIALALITLGLAYFTLRLWRTTSDLVSDGKEASKKELRAYVTVIIGDATFQEKEKNLKFQARPLMVNTGQTPAHSVGFKAKTAIMPNPLPENFDFPVEGNPIGQSVLGSGHNFVFGPPVDNFVDETQIDDIKKCQGKGLFVWGTVFYTDIFEENHTTDFCQMLCWGNDGKIFGYYDQRHNKAT